MILHRDVQQGTEAWHTLRRGRFTASEFSTLFMGKTTKGYNSLINTVVYERLTGETPETFSNDWMERGKQLEPEAIEAYELMRFRKVERVGFAEMDEWVGCSPDGLVGSDGMVQVKCPKFSTLIDYALSEKVPPDYMYQMQGEMMVTGRKWSDWVVYHPKLKLLIRRIERDEKMIESILVELTLAEELAKSRMKQLQERF